MRSYQFSEYGHDLALTERETPVPQGDEVLVRVEACGVCHSDLHMWDGYFDMGGGKKLDVSAARELPLHLAMRLPARSLPLVKPLVG